MALDWNDKDSKAVDTARILAADAVQKAGGGHPGTPISLSPLAYLLYQKVMNTDPADDKWLGRDRFILSAGHASLLQYAQLYLGGLGLELEDLKELRQWGSKTPGHPEYGHTDFVETTTGPLGAGIANGVGMAMAARRERGMLDPDAAPGTSPFDHFVYVIAGDGCLQEGVASEASSLAGTQELGNLILFYDDNHITIEGDTKIAFTEDVDARYEAYGWHVQHVDWTHGGTEYREDHDALYDAIEKAKAVTDKPSIIRLTTVIGWPLPTKAGDHSVHGSAIGETEISAFKKELGFVDEPFAVDQSIVDYTRASMSERGQAARAAWDEAMVSWRENNPDQAALLDRLLAGELPDLSIPLFPADKAIATRSASGQVITALGEEMPELWGGSADLAGSNNTTMKGQPSFLPAQQSSEEFQGNEYGRVLHFGVREHAMGGIINGMNLSGLTRAFCGTFLVFADYMRPTARLAALMNVPSIFVWTHDSVGVGGDGPTHQPVEQIASLRVIPNFDVVRPADANETAACWLEILGRTDRPAGLILSRQNLPVLEHGDELGDLALVTSGAYILKESSSEVPQLILIGTGSEVSLCLEAAQELEEQGIGTRVVSMPCQEWFNEMDQEYRDLVLPPEVTARVSVEAGVETGWGRYVGSQGASISIDHFGASADGDVCMREFGFTVDNVVNTAMGILA